MLSSNNSAPGSASINHIIIANLYEIAVCTFEVLTEVMKSLFIEIVLLAASIKGFSQRQDFYDSIVAHYNFLNNKPFAPLQLEDTTGNLFNTAVLTGKTVYVDFWFTACPPCIKEIPYAEKLQKYFAPDTNIVFLSICIENTKNKPTWKQMIKEKQMTGVHLFYARNRPQRINLLRQYQITFPTYLLLNKEMKVIGYDAPRPSQTGWVQWSILKAKEGKYLSQSFKAMRANSVEYKAFIATNCFSNRVL